MASYSLLSATAPATGAGIPAFYIDRTFQATVSGTGTVAATVIIDGSSDGLNFLELGRIILSGTTSASDGFISVALWPYVRARLTEISGTDAVISVVFWG